MVPEIGPMNSNWFEFMGPVAGTGPRNILLGPSCEQVRGTGPCDQLKNIGTLSVQELFFQLIGRLGVELGVGRVGMVYFMG